MADYSGYFLYHSVGHFPGKEKLLAKAYEEFAQAWSRDDDSQWYFGEAIQQTFLDRWTELLGAEEGTVAHSESVTSALHALISSLPADVLAGKRVLAPADSFPSLLFLLRGLEERYGYELEIVPLHPEAHWVKCEDISSRLDEQVGMVMLNWVSPTSSHRCDLAGLSKKARSAGAIVGADLTQAAGILPFDLGQTPLDFAVSTSLKWIGGVPGAGAMYVEPSLAQRCLPERRGWFSQENPFNWDVEAFAFAQDARRFHLATPSVVGCVGTVPALDWVLAGGAAKSRENNVPMVKSIMDMADDLKIKICSPRADHARGASIMLELPGDIESKESLANLRKHRLYADTRGRVLRLSPGVLSQPEMLDALEICLSNIAAGRV